MVSNKVILDLREIDSSSEVHTRRYERLRCSLFGRLGINFFRSLPLAKQIYYGLLKLWRRLKDNYFPSSYLSYPVVPISESLLSESDRTISFQSAEKVITPRPYIFPSGYNAKIVSPHDDYIFPPLTLFTFLNTIVTGGSGLLLGKGKVYCHGLLNLETDELSEELHRIVSIDPSSKQVKFLTPDPNPKRIEEAASFVDACASNYAHWLTEVLPRIALFCSIESFKRVPIVINSGLHSNLLETLLGVAGSTRKVYLLPERRAVRVEKLYVTSVAGYVPFQPRGNKLPGQHHGQFSPYALRLMVGKLKGWASRIEQTELPRKIFIRRNSEYRSLNNQSEIERAMVEQGFYVVEPEKLSFSQQVAMFSRAEVIVGATGAAFANIVFCKPTTKIVILAYWHKNMAYWYWQSIACATDNVINYVFGESLRKWDPHSDFQVRIEDILDSISV